MFCSLCDKSDLVKLPYYKAYATTGLLLLEQAMWTKADEDVLAANRSVHHLLLTFYVFHLCTVLVL